MVECGVTQRFLTKWKACLCVFLFNHTYLCLEAKDFYLSYIDDVIHRCVKWMYYATITSMNSDGHTAFRHWNTTAG